MIRAIRPNAMAQDDASLVTGWNISPNVAYTLVLTPGSSACGVLLFDADMSALVASGAALVGTGQPCVLVPNSGQVGMVDADIGWHLLLTTTGTESQRTIRIGPAVDLPDEIHPIYGDDALAIVRATAGVDDHAHYIDDVTVSCPFGLGAGIGDVASVPVDGSAADGQVESITWTGTPAGANDAAVIRRYVAIAPESHVDPVPVVPPMVEDDAAETDAVTAASGNVLTNDETGLTIVAINGLTAKVGVAVAGSDGGEFVVEADGSWTFDPAGDFTALSGSETADTSVTYHASDGVSEASATLTVTVTSGDAILWTPTEATTALWLDASDAATITLDGSNVSQWADKSGNSKHATTCSDSGISRPTRDTNSVAFAGAHRLSFPTVSNALCVAAVCRVDTFGTLPGLIGGYGLDYGVRHYDGVWRTGDEAGTNRALPNSAANVYVNGTQQKTFTQSVVQVAVFTRSLTAINIDRLGGYYDGRNLGGRIYELLVLPAIPSVELRQMIEGYLAHKWDALLGVTTLVSALPSGHPHKSAPPVLE